MMRSLKKSTGLIALSLLLFLLFWNIPGRVELPGADRPVLFYSSDCNDDLRVVVLDAIDSAKKSLFVAIYNMSDNKVITALKRAKERGVKVEILVDGEASPHLASLGAHTRRQAAGIMHIKILIVDEEVVLAGSANFSYSSLRIHHNLISAIFAPSLARTLQTTLEGYGTVARPDLTGSYALSLENQEIVCWLLPQRHVVEEIADRIDSAKKSVDIAMYVWTHPRLTRAVIEAKERGVDVRVIMDRRQAFGYSKKARRTLLEAGVPLRLSRDHGFCHHKMAMIDRKVLIWGSANWTRSAFQKNDEVLFIVEPLTKKQEGKLDCIFQRLVQLSNPDAF